MKKKYFLIGAILYIIDQISKILVDTFITDSVPVIKNFFSITKVNNTGAAFSILENKTWILILVSLIILFAIVKMSNEFLKNKLNTWSFGLLVGGILGNLSDRLFLGFVRDFLSFKIFGYNFPIFNIADTLIVIGVVLLLISTFIGGNSSENSSRTRRKSTNR